MNATTPRYWLPSGLLKTEGWGPDDTCVVPDWAYDRLAAKHTSLEARLREALELLKRSAGYASAYPTIGGHKLNDEICRFREAVQAELEINTQQAEEETHG
jgi:hypothetical protein